MSEDIMIYQGTVTENQSDGEKVSMGTGASPISFVLNAAAEEKAAVKLAVRCAAGMKADKITLSVLHKKADGATEEEKNKFKFCADNAYASGPDAVKDGEWSDSMEITNVQDTNRVFWFSSVSTKDEEAGVSSDYILHAAGILQKKETRADTDSSGGTTQDAAAADSGSTPEDSQPTQA